MFKLTFRNLLEKKIRFALTTLAVVLGVTFVVGVFVLTDSLRSTFGDLATEIAIYARIRSEFPGRTLLVVAHRSAIARTADQVVLMEEGRVVKTGTPGEVLDPSGGLSALAPTAPPIRSVSGGARLSG